MTGLELLRAVVAGERPQPEIGEALDMKLIEATFGRVVFQGRPTSSHMNMMGVIHGGYAATLLDSAIGCAIQSTRDSAVEMTTVALEVKLVGRFEPGRTVVAEGVVVHEGRTQSTAEGRLHEVGSRRLLAHGTATCIRVDAPGSSSDAPPVLDTQRTASES